VAVSSSPISGIAKRYASALFDLARDEKAVDKVEAELVDLKKALADSDDLHRLVTSPAFSAEDQERALLAVLKKAKASKLLASFLGIVARNRRLFALPGMIDAFQVMAAEARGEVAADVTSAEPLKDAQRKSLSTALKDAFGRDVTLNEIVDPAILGGLIVKVGSCMVDTSLRTRLNSLKIAMKEVG
jgi:F-type H+-transporting ATPase subunit delta